MCARQTWVIVPSVWNRVIPKSATYTEQKKGQKGENEERRAGGWKKKKEEGNFMSQEALLGSVPLETIHLSFPIRIDKNVERLEISVENGRVVLVEVIHSLSDVHSQTQTARPRTRGEPSNDGVGKKETE